MCLERQQSTAICRANEETGATGLEPATSGVTGRFGIATVDDDGLVIALFMRPFGSMATRFRMVERSRSQKFAARLLPAKLVFEPREETTTLGDGRSIVLGQGSFGQRRVNDRDAQAMDAYSRDSTLGLVGRWSVEAKYPRQPVTACPGYAARQAS
jgi:hypothetical protein